MEESGRPFNLPLLFDRHQPLNLYDLEVAQLRGLLGFLARCTSTGNGIRPQWWPKNLPFGSFNSYVGDGEEHLYRLMVAAVEQCYAYYDSSHIIKYCREMATRPTGDLKFEDHDDGTTSLYNNKGDKLLKYRDNRNCVDGDRRRPHASTRRLLPKVSRPQAQPCEIFLCGNCGGSFDNESLLQTHQLTCRVTAQDAPDSDDEIVDITEESRILSSLGLAETSDRAKKPRSPRKAQQPRRFRVISDYYKVDLSSPLGKTLVSRGDSGEYYEAFMKKHARSLSRTTNMRQCDMDGASSSFIRPHKSSKLAAILDAPWTHTYCFNKAQRREQKRVLETGLNRRARQLKRLCRRKLLVSVKKLTQNDVNRFTKCRVSTPKGRAPCRYPVVKLQKLEAATKSRAPVPEVSLVDSDDEVVIIEDEQPKLPPLPSGVTICKKKPHPSGETAGTSKSTKPVIEKEPNGRGWVIKSLPNGPAQWVKKDLANSKKPGNSQQGRTVQFTAAAQRSRRSPVSSALLQSMLTRPTAISGYSNSIVTNNLQGDTLPGQSAVSDHSRQLVVTSSPQQSRNLELSPAAELSRKTGTFQQSRKNAGVESPSSKRTVITGPADVAALISNRSGVVVSVVKSNGNGQRAVNDPSVKNGTVGKKRKSFATEECIDLCSSDDEQGSTSDASIVKGLPKNGLRHWPEQVRRTENAAANGGAEHMKGLLRRLLQHEHLGAVFFRLLLRHSNGVPSPEVKTCTKDEMAPPFKERHINIPSGEPNAISKELKSLFGDECKELKKLGLEAINRESCVQTRRSANHSPKKRKKNLETELRNLNQDEQKELKRLGLSLLKASTCTNLTRLKALEMMNE